MLGLFGRKAKALQLIRDTESIIRADEVAYADRHLEKISGCAQQSIQQALDELGDNSTQDKVPRWLKESHRDARKRNDQAALSGTTLAIIFLKAKVLEGDGQPACDAIEAFIARWPTSKELVESLPD